MVILYSGHVTDRIGRMNTIGLAGLLIAASLFILGHLTATGWPVFLAGLSLGLGWGLFYTLTPVVLADVIRPDERIRFFTLLSVFIMAGFGLTPILGALLTKAAVGVDVAFTIVAGLCGISSVLFFTLAVSWHKLQISVPKVDSKPDTNNANRLRLTDVKAVLRSPAVVPIIMVGLGASVFAAITNFQTVYAEQSGQNYAHYFLAYTLAVIICRVLFAEFAGGRSPYRIIAILLAIMTASILLFLIIETSQSLYILGAILFGVGYGVAYPIIKAMAANESDPALMSQTMQMFGLFYFIGVFGFPFIAGRVIVSFGIGPLLWIALALATTECLLAVRRIR